MVISEVKPRSLKRNPKCYILSEERNPVRKNLKEILVFCGSVSPSPAPPSPQTVGTSEEAPSTPLLIT